MPFASGRIGLPGEKLSLLWEFFAEVKNEHPEYFHVFAYLAQPKSTNAVQEGVKKEIALKSGDNFRLFAKIAGEASGEKNSRLVADLLWGSFFGLMVLKDSRANLGTKPHPEEKDLKSAFQLLTSGIFNKSSSGGKK